VLCRLTQVSGEGSWSPWLRFRGGSEGTARRQEVGLRPIYLDSNEGHRGAYGLACCVGGSGAVQGRREEAQQALMQSVGSWIHLIPTSPDFGPEDSLRAAPFVRAERK